MVLIGPKQSLELGLHLLAPMKLHVGLGVRHDLTKLVVKFNLSLRNILQRLAILLDVAVMYTVVLKLPL